MNAWVKWAGAPRFLLVDPHRSHLVLLPLEPEAHGNVDDGRDDEER